MNGAGGIVRHLPVSGRDSPDHPEDDALRRGTRRVFQLYVLFTLVLGLLFPVFVGARYGMQRIPLDFFRMPTLGADYLATYSAAKSLMHGLPVYANNSHYGPEFTDQYTIDEFSRYSYPPLQVFLLAPLALLPFGASYATWIGLSIALAALGWFCASRWSPDPWRAFIALAMIYGQSTFLLFQFERGQTDMLILASIALCAFFYLRSPRNPALAGLFLTLGAFLKLAPGLLALFFVARRDLRVLAWAAGTGAIVLVLTSIPLWLTWISVVLPHWADYFLGYTVDHSLRYFLEGFTHDPSTAGSLARLAGGVLAALYLVLAVLNKEKTILAPLDLAILTSIMEILTPWSANYKLVVLVFLFLAPFSILYIPFVRTAPVRYTLPLFFCFALMVPLFGEYLTRVPFSLAAQLAPSPFIPPNPLHPFLTDRKVASGVLLALVYLMVLFAVAIRRQYREGAGSERVRPVSPSARLFNPRSVATAALLLVAVGTSLATLHWYRTGVARYQSLAASFGGEQPLNESVALAGYDLSPNGGDSYHLELVFRSSLAPNRDLVVFAMAEESDADGNVVKRSGGWSFPSVISSAWPTDKYVAVAMDQSFDFPPRSLRITLLDGSTGRTHGEIVLEVRTDS